MKVKFIIEFETDGDGVPQKMKVNRLHEVAPAPPGTKLAKIADIAPEPIPPEPEIDTPKVKRAGSGPQFDPGFLKIIQDAHEPFTRRSVAVATGLNVTDVTMRFNRMRKHKWIEQPAPGMWRRTKTFGVKP